MRTTLAAALTAYGTAHETHRHGWVAHGLADALRWDGSQGTHPLSIGRAAAGVHAYDYELGFSTGLALRGGDK